MHALLHGTMLLHEHLPAILISAALASIAIVIFKLSQEGPRTPAVSVAPVAMSATSRSSMSMSASPLPQPSGMPKASAAPMPMASGMPMGSMMGNGTHMDMSKATNGNGVMSMYGTMHMNAGEMSVRSMPAVTDLGVPMSREGSGTSWLPDSSTTFGHMSVSGDNMLMAHGAGFVRYSDTFTDRGSRTFNAPDWYMIMGSHPLSPASQLDARA